MPQPKTVFFGFLARFAGGSAGAGAGAGAGATGFWPLRNASIAPTGAFGAAAGAGGKAVDEGAAEDDEEEDDEEEDEEEEDEEVDDDEDDEEDGTGIGTSAAAVAEAADAGACAPCAAAAAAGACPCCACCACFCLPKSAMILPPSGAHWRCFRHDSAHGSCRGGLGGSAKHTSSGTWSLHLLGVAT
jgi:hypothetical protein